MHLKIIGICLLLFTFNLFGFEIPKEFQLRQEPSRRTISILEGTRFLGAVLNSDYGQFDFYDSDKTKIATNLEDVLFDAYGNALGFITWEKDAESKKWIWQRKCPFCDYKTHIILYSDDGTPVLTLDEEGEGDCFVFRECDTRKPLAVAYLYWSLLGNSCIAAFDGKVQNWHVIVVEESLLREKNIPFLFLIWPLMKHSQLYFPEPRIYPYESELK